MQFYKFWTRGESKFRGNQKVTCLGYSNISLEDALRVAEKRAGDVARRIETGTMEKGGYYPDSPIREEITEEFYDNDNDAGNDKVIAVITRNSYGCLVLNSPQVFFADVDVDFDRNSDPQQAAESKTQPGFFDAIQGIFGKSKALDGLKGVFDQVKDLTKPEGSDLGETLQQIADSDPTLLMRLYRTLMGFRVMIVSRLIPATDIQSRELLVKMGADKLYASLCRTQDCYRARLTPKSWRIGYTKPGVRFPFESAAAVQQIRTWKNGYEPLAANFSTCHLVGEFGSAAPHPVAQKVAELHDHYSINGNKPLA